MSAPLARFARWRDAWRRFRGRGVYPHQLAFLLTLPLRRWIQPPAALVAGLRLAPDARVLEIGCGPGYFSVAAERALPQGLLVLYDLQREMLAKARRRLRRAGAKRYALVQGDAARLPFVDFDAVFLVAVLGEVHAPAACLASIHGALRPGGALSITETIGDPDAFSEDELRSLAEANAFAVEEVTRERAGFTMRLRPLPSGAAAA